MSRTVARRVTLLQEALEVSSIPRARQKICRFSRFLHPRRSGFAVAVRPIWPSMPLTAPSRFREGATFTGRWWAIPSPTAAVQRCTTTCISAVWEGREQSCWHGARCSEVSSQLQSGEGSPSPSGNGHVAAVLGTVCRLSVDYLLAVKKRKARVLLVAGLLDPQSLS